MVNPANKIVSLKSNAVIVCEDHAKTLADFAKATGCFIALTTVASHKIKDCQTCINEGK